MKILVTGFAPFDGGSVNPSEQIVALLRAPAGATLIRAVLPVTFDGAAQELLTLLETHQPDAVLSIGQANGRRTITVERVAVNLDSVKTGDGRELLPDNAGALPIDEPIDPQGAAAYFTTLPLWQTVEAIQTAGFPAEVSDSAGTFVCNHVLYTALQYAAQHRPGMTVGFIHVPLLPEQAAEKNAPSLPLDDMVSALQSALDALAR